MHAGRMNRRIEIQQVVEVLNSFNEPIETWKKYRTVWSEVVPVRTSSGEAFRAPQLVSVNRVIFRIRYISGITNKMRISYGGDYYDIKTSAELGRREVLEILAELSEG